MSAPLALRNETIVARYRAGETMAQIGRSLSPPITPERVRQIIARWERGRSAPITRHYRPVERVLWRCPGCGEERSLAPSRARAKRQCVRCRNAMPAARVLGWIEDRRQGQTYRQVGVSAGYPPNQAWTVDLTICLYLLRHRRHDTIAELWPQGLPRWLRNHRNVARYLEREAA